MGLPIRFIGIIIFSDEVLKYGNGVKTWGYVGASTELIHVELLNNVSRRASLFKNVLLKLMYCKNQLTGENGK
jgi:hypothetical protein